MSDLIGLIGIVALFFGYVAILMAVVFGMGKFTQRFGMAAVVPCLLAFIGGGLAYWWRLNLGETHGEMTVLRWASWLLYGAGVLFAVESLIGWGLWFRSGPVVKTVPQTRGQMTGVKQ